MPTYHATTKIRRGAQPPGELIYLSERKLLNMARSQGLDTAWFDTDVTAQVEGQGALPLLPGTGACAGGKVIAQRVDPQPRRERAMEQALEKLLRRLSKYELADLDAGEQGVHEGDWFRFHRRLRFGVGTDDSTGSVRALILVDQEPVDDSGIGAGLLMNGDPKHLRPPYRPDDVDDHPGHRSGSGTGRLFRWLNEAREAHEKTGVADRAAHEMGVFATDPPTEGGKVPVSMYNLFARDDWMTDPRFPQLVNPAACEGIAKAYLVRTWEQTTVVMGSPLYARTQSVPEVEVGEDAHRRDVGGRSGFISRLFRRPS